MVGFALMQGAMQAGRGVIVVPILSVLSNLVPIVGGRLVYGEPLSGEGIAGLLRPMAVLLTLGGAALLGALGSVDVPLHADGRSEQDRAQ